MWALRVFKDFLYVTTGFAPSEDPDGEGYGVFKTAAEGDPPYDYTPLVTDGGFQTDPRFRASNSFNECSSP